MATIVASKEFTGNPRRQLAKLFDVSLKLTVPDEPNVEPLIEPGKFGDYQWCSLFQLKLPIKLFSVCVIHHIVCLQ
jgi:hypothetical protein